MPRCTCRKTPGATTLERLTAAGVPEGIGYRPRWQIGLALLERARANGLGGVVLADCAYGDVTEFRQASTRRAGRWCVGVEKTLKVIAADADPGEVPPYTGRGGRRRDRRK